MKLPAVLIFLALPIHALAQETAPQVRALGAVVGSWTYDSIVGGSECAWLGDLIVQCRSHSKRPDGTEQDIVFLMSWDATAQQLRSHRFYSSGYADSGTTWIDGNTWTTVYQNPNGTAHRQTAVFDGDRMTYVWHRSLRGGPWEQTSQGSMTRLKKN